jgi:tRNA(fMet)-specific endonuclease VapC
MNPTLLDTDTLSYFMKGNPNVCNKIDAYLRIHSTLNISLITYYEILNGLYFKDAKRQLQDFEKFIALHQVLPLSLPIAQLAAFTFADLRKNALQIGHNDCLIAATAIHHDLTLITNNSRHFSRINGLEQDNWLI